MSIPYFEQPHLGPFHAFGALVAAAVLFGTHVLQKRATHERLDPELASRQVFWVLVSGFIGAHLVHSLVYFPSETLEDPISILKVWEGISSFGGFLGAVVGLVLFSRRDEFRALSMTVRWRYIDVVAYAFVMGWAFGRAGCTVAFDHPGSVTTFFLGFTDKAGDVRHNLGLYEALYFVPLMGLFWLLGRKVRRFGPGFFAGLVPVLYAPFRFSIDFLRHVDVRYGGLTPAQWGCFAVFGAGLFVMVRSRRLVAVEASEPEPEAAPASRGGGGKGKKKKR
jgi:phosphatidylglycerol:prolipoprotein diacylglycerol transferase